MTIGLKHFNIKVYGLELKSFTDQKGFRQALEQAARYGKIMDLGCIFPVTFVESIDEKNRRIYEVDYENLAHGVTVKSIFISTGSI